MEAGLRCCHGVLRTSTTAPSRPVMTRSRDIEAPHLCSASSRSAMGPWALASPLTSSPGSNKGR
eukprot:14524414-Alexandrium_andersonii.AAC.1